MSESTWDLNGWQGAWDDDEPAPSSPPTRTDGPALNSDPLTPRELVSARDHLGWSQSQMAAHLGVSLKTVKAWERRKRDSESRNCTGSARRLLRLVVGHPELVIDLKG